MMQRMKKEAAPKTLTSHQDIVGEAVNTIEGNEKRQHDEKN